MYTRRTPVIKPRVVQCSATMYFGVALAALVLSPSSSAATCFDNGEFAVIANNPAGIIEPAVSVACNGVALGSFKAVEIYDRVLGTNSFPLTHVDLVSNFFARSTPQLTDGTSSPLTISTIGSGSFRRSNGVFSLIPQAETAVIDATQSGYRATITGHFGADATVVSTRTLLAPEIGRTTVTFEQSFTANREIALASGAPFVGNDRFRAFTISSMFVSESLYDTNLIQWKDNNGVLQTFVLSDNTARDRHLFAAPIEISGEVQLIKTPGSTWFPGSPNLQVTVLDDGGARLGLQGFLAASNDPNDDTLSLWFEFLDAPDVIPANSRYDQRFQVRAEPSPVPLPSTLWLLGSAFSMLAARRKRDADYRSLRQK